MSISQIIEIPSAPANITGEPNNLYGVKVKVHMADESIFSGTIDTISQIKNSLSYKSEETGKIEIIFYSNLRYIEFTQVLEVKPDIFKQDNEQNSSGIPCNPFHVDFHYGPELDGETFTSLETESSLNFFLKINQKSACRIFIPKENINTYTLGAKLGELLKAQHDIEEVSINTGLSQQKELREKKLGCYLTENGIVSEKDLQFALSQQQDTVKHKIGDILIAEGLVTQEELEAAVNLQKEGQSKKLGDLLVDMGAATESDVYAAIAKKLGLPFVKLDNYEIDSDAIGEIPAHIAKAQQAIPIAFNNKHLVVAVANPSELDFINILSFVSNRNIDLVISPQSEIEAALEQYYNLSGDSSFVLREAELDQEVEEDSGIQLEQMANERPIVRLVNQIFADAHNRRASDIHIRPKRKSVELLYRINGSMVHIRNLGKSLLPAITSRIKILGKMDISQRRLPHDGRIQVSMGGGNRDLRVSIMPTIHGESTSIRLLALSNTLAPLDTLGLNETDLGKFQELLHRGGGIILVTGPTGSGKTTTLYSALNELREHELNIITIEDPVEIQLDGLEQIQVAKNIDFTFAKALRNILRHDPDIIMLGEIRDEETAEITIQCAQTGHLVLSTLHTNTAVGTISRLQQMGIPSYLLASTVLGVLAQRLLRKNCQACIVPEEVNATTRRVLNLADEEEFFQGRGCKACNNTGYIGRLPVYELMIVNDEIKEVLMNKGSESQVQSAAVNSGLETIIENALRHAREGKTSIAEVHKIYSS